MAQKISMEDLVGYIQRERKLQSNATPEPARQYTIELLDRMMNWAENQSTVDTSVPPQKY